MIKTIIFDLDGTLIDTKGLHNESFYWALQQESSEYALSEEDKEFLEGRPSLTKIDYLIEKYHWDLDRQRIYENKQKYTLENKHLIYHDSDIPTLLRELKQQYQLCLASNARSEFVFSMINDLNLNVFDIILTANYIPLAFVKPNPYMFLKCMEITNSPPAQTLIFEDSEVGLAAAYASGARVKPVSDSTSCARTIREILCK